MLCSSRCYRWGQENPKVAKGMLSLPALFPAISIFSTVTCNLYFFFFFNGLVFTQLGSPVVGGSSLSYGSVFNTLLGTYSGLDVETRHQEVGRPQTEKPRVCSALPRHCWWHEVCVIKGGSLFLACAPEIFENPFLCKGRKSGRRNHEETLPGCFRVRITELNSYKHASPWLWVSE